MIPADFLPQHRKYLPCWGSRGAPGTVVDQESSKFKIKPTSFFLQFQIKL